MTELGRTVKGMLYCLLAASMPLAFAQNSQQQPSTRPAPGSRPPGQGSGGQKPPGQGGGSKPPGNQPPGNRPPGQGGGGKPPGIYPPPGNNPPGNKPPGNRPPGNKPPSNRPPGIYPPPGNKPPSNRPPVNYPTPRPPSSRPPQWGRPPAHRPPPYYWRPNDRAYLHRYYSRNLSYINVSRRPVFVVGGFFPFADFGYITPLPAQVYGYLPPPPPGYQMGYYQGYVVVYDPVTGFIVNVIDLLQ